jgi:hypothetical protein
VDKPRHLEGLLILIVVLILGGLYLWQNNQPSVMVAVPAATPTYTGIPPADWLEEQVALAGTPLPTPDVELATFIAPTLPPAGETVNVVLPPDQIEITPWPTSTPRPTITPQTISGPTPFPSPTGVFLPDDEEIVGFQPPPEQVPLELSKRLVPNDFLEMDHLAHERSGSLPHRIMRDLVILRVTRNRPAEVTVLEYSNAND